MKKPTTEQLAQLKKFAVNDFMKSAEDWQVNLVCCQSHWDRLRLIRSIQADALRWAANLSGDLHRKAALDKADELDPPSNK